MSSITDVLNFKWNLHSLCYWTGEHQTGCDLSGNLHLHFVGVKSSSSPTITLIHLINHHIFLFFQLSRSEDIQLKLKHEVGRLFVDFTGDLWLFNNLKTKSWFSNCWGTNHLCVSLDSQQQLTKLLKSWGVNNFFPPTDLWSKVVYLQRQKKLQLTVWGCQEISYASLHAEILCFCVSLGENRLSDLTDLENSVVSANKIAQIKNIIQTFSSLEHQTQARWHCGIYFLHYCLWTGGIQTRWSEKHHLREDCCAASLATVGLIIQINSHRPQ